MSQPINETIQPGDDDRLRNQGAGLQTKPVEISDGTREGKMHRVCLNCGMRVDDSVSHCPKCDNALNLQHDGSTVTVDIAHQGERVAEALVKMQKEIDLALAGTAMSVRLIVGSGLIREEVLLALRDLEFRGDIKSFGTEPFNKGAVLVRLK